MAMTVKVNIEDFEFAFNLDFGQDGGGITISESTNIAAKGFLDALYVAQGLFPRLNAAAVLENYAHGYSMDCNTVDKRRFYFYSRDEDHVLEIVKCYELARQQQIIEITEKMEWYALGARAELVRRENKKEKEQSEIKKGKKSHIGYVYLIRSSTGHFKIGRTKNPNDRIRTFSIKLPFEVEYDCLIKTDDMGGLEAKLHEKFNHKRINGEWFNLETEDIEYIKGLAS